MSVSFSLPSRLLGLALSTAVGLAPVAAYAQQKPAQPPSTAAVPASRPQRSRRERSWRRSVRMTSARVRMVWPRHSRAVVISLIGIAPRARRG